MPPQFTTLLDFTTVPDYLGLTGASAPNIVGRLDRFAAEEWHWTDNNGRREQLRRLLLQLVPTRKLEWLINGLMTMIHLADCNVNVYDDDCETEKREGSAFSINEDNGVVTAATGSPALIPDDDTHAPTAATPSSQSRTSERRGDDHHQVYAADTNACHVTTQQHELRGQLEHTHAEYDDLNFRYAVLDTENQLLCHRDAEQQYRVTRLTDYGSSLVKANSALTAEVQGLRAYKDGVERAASTFHATLAAANAALKHPTPSVAITPGESDDSGIEMDTD
ncbi:hypothetical protein LTR36_008305 [Oleoguttula mirabilis]|uniref:Uncharacterized protein n=1 Tax=Oleoguttula mirabilis TaxID=1507867 RepID=A0AAV9J857_9PEZI|nr:hypothetical protein LTR36_008305 [Oleoguttula mirabilis]